MWIYLYGQGAQLHIKNIDATQTFVYHNEMSTAKQFYDQYYLDRDQHPLLQAALSAER